MNRGIARLARLLAAGGCLLLGLSGCQCSWHSCCDLLQRWPDAADQSGPARGGRVCPKCGKPIPGRRERGAAPAAYYNHPRFHPVPTQPVFTPRCDMMAATPCNHGIDSPESDSPSRCCGPFLPRLGAIRRRFLSLCRPAAYGTGAVRPRSTGGSVAGKLQLALPLAASASAGQESEARQRFGLGQRIADAAVAVTGPRTPPGITCGCPNLGHIGCHCWLAQQCCFTPHIPPPTSTAGQAGHRPKVGRGTPQVSPAAIFATIPT